MLLKMSLLPKPIAVYLWVYSFSSKYLLENMVLVINAVTGFSIFEMFRIYIAI